MAGKLNEILTQNKKGTGDIGGTLEYEALDSAVSTRVREKNERKEKGGQGRRREGRRWKGRGGREGTVNLTFS